MALTGLGLGLSALGGIASGVSGFLEARGAISEDEQKRLRELERMEAIGMLGGDINAAMGRQMTPVQGAMREARERMAQDISAQDISSGAYFRGQQAMESAAAKERSAAAERAQADIAQQEAINRQQMETLRQQQKIRDNALIYGLKSAVEPLLGIGAGITEMGVSKDEQDRLMKIAEARNAALGIEQEDIDILNRIKAHRLNKKNKNNNKPG